MHSANVYKALVERYFNSQTDNLESFTICALLHDLCKAQFYKISTRNVKNETTGEWEKQLFYQVEDAFPYGCGEKSVFLIEHLMILKTSEAIAIRRHMGGFDESAKGREFAMSLVFDKFPIAVKMYIAYLEATYLMEERNSD